MNPLCRMYQVRAERPRQAVATVAQLERQEHGRTPSVIIAHPQALAELAGGASEATVAGVTVRRRNLREPVSHDPTIYYVPPEED